MVAAAQGRVVDTLFSHVDMPPTLLGLAGIEFPRRMQGTDLANVALGRSTAGPEAVLLQIFVPFAGDSIHSPWRGLITAQHTYARYENEPWVLFDNATDPHQLKNLATDPAHARTRAVLDGKLAAMMKETGDAWSFNRHEKVEENARLYSSQTFYTVDDYLAGAKVNPGKKK